MTDAAASLIGLRLLVVEDEAMVAMMLEDMLDTLGCVVVDIAGSLEKGLKIAEDETMSFDVAILDVNLGGDRVFPVAKRLSHRRVPFIFCTGYGRLSEDTGFAHMPILSKPYTQAELGSMLMSTLVEAQRH